MTLPDAIKGLQDAMLLDREYSHWAKEQSLRDRLEELAEEVRETLAEVDGPDEKLQDEFGDLFLDLMAAAIIAEEQGRICIEESINGSVEKLRRRKPHIFEKRMVADADEEVRIWNAAKREERE